MFENTTQLGEGAHAAETFGPDVKPTNPKDAMGMRKTPLSTLPWRVLWRVGLAMMEGALKYGRHNYRAVGVRASVYFDSTHRHFGAWWEGQDIDPDSNLHHIDKTLAGLVVLRDGILRGNWIDDRPPSSVCDMPELDQHAAALMERYGDRKPHHYTVADNLPVSGRADNPAPPRAPGYEQLSEHFKNAISESQLMRFARAYAEAFGLPVEQTIEDFKHARREPADAGSDEDIVCLLRQIFGVPPSGDPGPAPKPADTGISSEDAARALRDAGRRIDKYRDDTPAPADEPFRFEGFGEYRTRCTKRVVVNEARGDSLGGLLGSARLRWNARGEADGATVPQGYISSDLDLVGGRLEFRITRLGRYRLRNGWTANIDLHKPMELRAWNGEVFSPQGETHGRARWTGYGNCNVGGGDLDVVEGPLPDETP